MTTGIQDAGTDLDAIFEPRTTTKVADVNIHSNGGVDISNRFEDLNSGSGAPATNIHAGDTDLYLIFAELGSVGGLQVSLRANGDYNTRNGGTCHAGIRIASTGTEYEFTNTGSQGSSATWLDSGNASDVWVKCISSNGTWTTHPGTARYRLNTTRTWEIEQPSVGDKFIDTYFELWDAASGGTLLQRAPTSGTVRWTAERVS
jgi:hypothetical protein